MSLDYLHINTKWYLKPFITWKNEIREQAVTFLIYRTVYLRSKEKQNQSVVNTYINIIRINIKGGSLSIKSTLWIFSINLKLHWGEGPYWVSRRKTEWRNDRNRKPNVPQGTYEVLPSSPSSCSPKIHGSNLLYMC